MSLKEIRYRVLERLRIETDRTRYVGSLNPQSRRRSRVSFRELFRESAAKHFYFSLLDQMLLTQQIQDAWPQWIRNATEEADRLSEHRIEILGYGERHLGAQIDWFADPLTGERWPRRFWADYDPVRDHGARDVKLVHELNRHQHLPRLAKAYFLTGQERFAREAIAQMLSWIEQNPPGIGLNWQSSLEIGIRSISWLWAIAFFGNATSFNEEAASSIGQSLVAQLNHVYRYPSMFSSPNTHLIGEAAALFIAGTMLSGLAAAGEWQQLGASLLMREMDSQITDEGVHKELSSSYHCYTVDFYLQAMTLGRKCGWDFPSWMWQRLSQMTEFLMHLSRPDGSIPLLGDDDGGRVLALGSRNYSIAQDLFGVSAVLFERSDFKQMSGEFREEVFWIAGGSEAYRVYSAQSECRVPALCSIYEGAGYATQRGDWTRDSSSVVFDFGGLGMLNGGHGHADALSIVLSIGSTQMLTDSGTYRYNAAPEWRRFFRSTPAHNTVTIDSVDQSEPGDTFKWKTRAECRLVRRLSVPEVEYVEAEHDGYARLPEPITHRRRLIFVPSNLWVLVDDFRGEGKHRFDVNFHFPPNASISLERTGGKELGLWSRVEGAALRMQLMSSSQLLPEAVCGAKLPTQGWHSSSYGSKQPATAVSAVLHADAPATVMSFILPSSGDGNNDFSGSFRQIEMDRPSVCCGEVERGLRKDLFAICLDGAPFRIGNHELHGDFFWLHSVDGQLTQFLAVDALAVVQNGTDLFRSCERQECVLSDAADPANGRTPKVSNRRSSKNS